MQQCPACAIACPDGAKFCAECGTPLARTCPSCGHPATGGRFCMECGTPLESGVAAPVPRRPATGVPVSERRTTTVLFGDLVGFTTLSESRDPEEVRELLSAYFGVARTVVGRYGGTIEKFIGDAVMAVWGVPTTHEDDAERAVRAGLDLVAEVAALGERVGAPDLAMRAGLVTGSVAVTLGATNEGMVAGDAVNTASRVQAAAAPGTVWVDQETQSLTAAAIAYADMGEHELKGKAEPVRLFRAAAIVAAVGGAQRVDGLEAPMVGREAEMRRVKELFHATETDGRSRLVLVTGEAGLGKSRLGWEFYKYVDGLSHGVAWHRGRSLSYGDGVAFWAFAEMVRSRLGILEDDDAASVAEKVRTGVAAVCLTPAEAAWLTPRVAALLGAGDRSGFDRTDLFASWTTFLERVGGEDPVVLLFEDMQYADSGLLDLVEHLLETSRARLFVLGLTRPDLVDARPSLAAGRRSSVVQLEPLPEAAVAALLDGLVEDLPAAARAALVARADGVPLYAVETVRSLIDRDAVVAREGRYVFVDHDHRLVDLAQLAAPTTLQTLVAARLDQLDPTERRVVQDASVLGLSFRPEALAKLAGLDADRLDGVLGALVRKGLIGLQTEFRSAEAGQYRFLQALVREVAYGTLARKDRRALHLAAAAHLEEEGGDAVAGIVAQHLMDALEAGGADDAERPALLARARTLLMEAAGRAEALGSPEEALHACESALVLEPDETQRAQLLLRAGRVADMAGRKERAEELARQAETAYTERDSPGDVAAALLVLARAMVGLGRTAEGGDAARRGLAQLDRLDAADQADPGHAATRVSLLVVVGLSARAAGQMDVQRATAIEAAAIAETLEDRSLLVRALNVIGIGMQDAEVPTAYRALLEAALGIAREERMLTQLAQSLNNLCSAAYPDDLVAAAEMAREGVEVGKQGGDVWMTEFMLSNAGIVWWLRGEWDLLVTELGGHLEDRELASSHAGLVLCLQAVRRARGEQVPTPALLASDDPWDQLATAVATALGEAASGDVRGAAARVAAVAREVVGQARMHEDLEVLLGPAVELQFEAGDAETAAELLALVPARRRHTLTRAVMPRWRGLVELARGDDPEADLREAETALAAYGAPYLLARTRLELGRWLFEQGRTLEAVPLLAQAREVFVELRAAPSVEEVDAVAVAVAH